MSSARIEVTGIPELTSDALAKPLTLPRLPPRESQEENYWEKVGGACLQKAGLLVLHRAAKGQRVDPGPARRRIP